MKLTKHSIKAAVLPAFCTAAMLLAACSSDDSTQISGVLTETESGKTIAGSVKDTDGYPAKNIKVNLLTKNHVAARMVPLKTVYTAGDGSYALDSISTGDYAIQIQDETNALSAYVTVSVKVSDQESIALSPSRLTEDAALEIPLAEYALSEGDTFCLTGTLNCATVDSAAIANKALVVPGIPAAQFENASFIQANAGIKDKDVNWTFKEGRTLHVATLDSSKIVGEYEIEIPEQAFDSAKTLAAPHSLDGMIVPVNFDTPYKNPSLVDEVGEIIPLTALSGDETHTRYLAILPKVNTSHYKFLVMENDDAAKVLEITSAYDTMDTTKSISEGDFWGGIQLYHHSLAISFWVDTNGATIADEDAFILNSISNDIGFRIGQCEAGSTDLCTALYNRTDSVSNDTILNHRSNILDGQKHHYSMVIKERHVSIVIDGETVRDTDVKTQSNFYMLPGISTGKYVIKDLFIYSIPDSIRHNNDKEWERLRAWLHAFYYIAKHEDSRSR